VGTNLQERLLRQLNCPKQQMMFASNMMGAAWVTLGNMFFVSCFQISSSVSRSLKARPCVS
jgi:hypothetical protein